MDYSKNITDSECSLDKYYFSSKQETSGIPPVYETSNIGNRSENVEALEEFKKMGLGCVGCQDYQKVAELQEKKNKIVNTTASIGYSGSSEPIWEIESEVGSKRVKPRATVLRLTQKGHMEEGVSPSSVKVFASKSEKRKKRKETVDPRVTFGQIEKGPIETATRADYYIDQVEKSKVFASAGKENRLADKASLKTAPLIGPVSTYGVIVETKKGDNQNQIDKSFQMETIRQPLLQKPKSSERICMRKASTHVECFSKSAYVTEKSRRGSPQTEAAEEAEHCSGIAENKTCHNKPAKMQNKNQHKSEVSSITRNALEANISSSTEVTHACGEEDQENVQFVSELADYEKHFLAKLARSDIATSRFVEKYLLSSRKFAPSLELSDFKESEETTRPALTKGRLIENIAESLTGDEVKPRSTNQNGLDISVDAVKRVSKVGTDHGIENIQELGRLDITSSHCKDDISSQTISSGSQTVVSPALEYAPVGTIIKKQRKASCKKQRRIERNQRIENGDTILIHESQSLKRPRVEGADSVVENSKKLRTERVIPVKLSSLGISRVALPRPFPKCHVSEHKNKPLEISGVALPRPFPKCHVSENENKSLEISGVALPRPFPKCHLSERENEPLVHEEETAYREASSSEKNALKCGRISSTEGESSSTSVSGNMSEAVTNGLAKPRISIDKSMPTRIPLRIKKCMQLPLENITKAHIKRIKKWYKMGTWNDVLNKHEMNELSTNISPGEHDPSGHVWSKQQVSGVPFIPTFILDKLEALKQLSRDELTKGQRVAVNKWQKLLNKKTRLENQHMEQMKQIKNQSVKRPQAEDSDSIRRVSKKSRTKVNTAPTRSSLEMAGVVDGISKPAASDQPEISSMKDIHKQTNIEGSIREDASRELSSSVSNMLVSTISKPNKICGGNSPSNSCTKPAAVTLSTEKSNHLCGDVSNHEADRTIASSMPPAPCHNVHVRQNVRHPAGSSGSEEYISTDLEIKSAKVVNGSEASISAKPTGVDQFGSLKAVSLHQDVSGCVRHAEESSLHDQKLTSCTGNVLKSSKSKSTGYASGSGRTSKVSVSAEAAGTCSQFGPPQELDSLIELILKSSEDGDGYSCSKTPDISVSAKTTGTTPQFSCTEAASRVQDPTDYATRSTEEMRCPVETVVISDSARLLDPHTQPATATALLPELGNALEKVPKPTDGTSKTDTSNSIGTTAACVSSKPVESYDKPDSSKVAELLEDATVCIENISKSAKTYSQVGSPKTSGVTERLSSCLENKLKRVQHPAAEGASTGSAVSVSAKPVDTCSQFVSPQQLNRSTEHMVKPAEDESTGYSCSETPVMSVSAKITGSTSQSSCTVAAGLVQELSNPTDITRPTEEVNCSAETSVISDSTTKLADQSATVAGLLPQLDNALGKVPQPTDSTSMTGTSSSVETTAACISSESLKTDSESGSSKAARLLEEPGVCIENISKSKEGAPCASSHSPKNFSQVGSPKASRPPEEQGAITESPSVSVPIPEFNFKVTKPLQESGGFIGYTTKPSQDKCASTADASSSLETLAICVFDKAAGTCSQSGVTTQTGLIQEPTSSLLNKLNSTTEGICSSVERSSLIACDESVDIYSQFDSVRTIRPLHESIENISKSAGDTSTGDISSSVGTSEPSDSAISGDAYSDLDSEKVAGLIQELDDCINEILNPAEGTSNSVETSVINVSAKSEDIYSQAGRVENLSKPLGDGSKEDTSNSSSCVSNNSAETNSQMVFPNQTGPLQKLGGCIEKLSKKCTSKETATSSLETSAVCLSAESSDTCSQVDNVEAEQPLQNFKVCIGNVSKPTKGVTRSVETSAEYVPEENISKLPECKSGTVPSSDVGISATPPSADSKGPLQKQEVGIENIPKLTGDAISSVRTLVESVSANSTDTRCQVGFAQTNGPAPAQETKTSIENFLTSTKDTSTSASTSSVGKVTEFVSAKPSDVSFNSKPLTESESVRNTDSCAETSMTPSFSELAAKHGQFCFVKEIELHQGVISRIANTPKATENKSDNISNPCLICLEKDLKNPAESFEEATIAAEDISKLPERKSGTVPSSDVGISAVHVSVNSSDTYSQLGPVEPEESIRKLNVGIQNIPKPTEDATSSVRTSAESVSAKSADTCSQVSLGKTNGPAEESYTSRENISKPTKDTSISASSSSVGNVTEFVSSVSTINTGSCTEISITPSFSELAVKHDQFCFVMKIELLQGETGPIATQNNFDNNIADPCLTHTVNPAGSVEEATIAGEDIAKPLECKSGSSSNEAKESLQKLEGSIENISKLKEDATTSLRTSTESVSVNSADTSSQMGLLNTNGPVQESNTTIENISRLTNDTSTSASTSSVGTVTEFIPAKPSDISFNTKSLTESESIRSTGSCEATLATPSFSELAAKHGQFSFVKEIELLQGETSHIAKTPNATQNNFVNNIANPCLIHTGKDSVNPAGSFEEATIAGEDISEPLERKSGTVTGSEIQIPVVPVPVKAPNALPQCSFAEAARQLQSVRVSAVADRTAVNLEETSVSAKPMVASDETVKTPVAPVQEVNTCKGASKPVMSKSKEAASTSETKSVTAAKKASSATVDAQKENQSRKRRHDADSDGPGDIKRQRTKASLCPYRVAVVDKGYPEVILTRDQSDAIEMELADRLEKATRFDASATYQFSNCSYAGGVLWICCEDGRTKVWVKRNITRMSSFWRGIRLKAVDETDLPVRLKVMVFVPDHEPELKKFITCLDRENPGLTASNWHLIGKKSEDGGVIFAFTIDDNSYAMLENNDWQVSYKRASLECKIMHKISDMWEYTSDGAGTSGTSKPKGREGNDKGYPASWRNAQLKQSKKKKRYGNVRSFDHSIQVPYNGFLRF